MRRLSRLLRLLSALVCAWPIQAATAVLECTGDTSPRAAPKAAELDLAPLLLEFRFASVSGWTIRKAELFLHLAAGVAPPTVRIAVIDQPWRENSALPKFRLPAARSFPVAPQPQGWLRVDLDPALVQRLAAGRGYGLAVTTRGAVRAHSRETVQHAPYLIVEGEPVGQLGKLRGGW